MAAVLSLPPGIAIGSFLNVVVARVPLHQSIVAPSSRCMSCGNELAWYDNVPVVSWVVLRGRCRTCGTSISWRYPAVEALTAVVVGAAFLKFGATWLGLLAACWCAVLIALAAIDAEHRIVPNKIVLPAAAVILVFHTVIDPSVAWVIGAFAASLFLFIAALVYPAGMGMGDVKLALLLGAMLGKLVSVGMFLGFLLALVPSVILFARHGSAARKMGVPFAPFLALGCGIALFAGDPIWHWYRSLGQ
jgi:leader peptidase (prepilin peptidase)/N-methyltransferase